MRLLIAFAFCVCLFAAEDPAKKTSPAPSVPSAGNAGVKIPAAAVKSSDGSYLYTDRQGKKWIYRKTPFGIARFEDKPAPDPAAAARYAGVKATADGDMIRFERPGPFGVYKWQRKKTELDEMEQAVWNREQSRTAARQE
ncbi:MAG TPA: hypothetical protein VKU19_35870 [Bryobacteraceae bacterium]|nr:hypothetical protein [Bryobacteraceae bacterium]